MERISKTEFKAHALEVLRDIEQSGQPRIITDLGRLTLEIRKLRQQEMAPLEILKTLFLSMKLLPRWSLMMIGKTLNDRHRYTCISMVGERRSISFGNRSQGD